MDVNLNPARNRIRLLDEKTKEQVTIGASKNRIRIIDKQDTLRLRKAASSRVNDAETKHSKKISIKPQDDQVKVH